MAPGAIYTTCPETVLLLVCKLKPTREGQKLKSIIDIRGPTVGMSVTPLWLRDINPVKSEVMDKWVRRCIS